MARAKVENINGQELIDMIENKTSDYQFVDVRTPGEFNSGKIKEFINIPLQVLETGMDALDKEKPVVVMCESGSRSLYAARILSSGNFMNILNVRGGISIFR